MKDNESFEMTYSAQQQAEINQIRNKYLPKKEDKMDILRKLDRQVGQKATAYSIAVGILGTILFGLGMSIILSDLKNLFQPFAYPLGIIIGIVGFITLAFAYPLYHQILKKERKKIAPQIIQLTDEMLK